MNLVSQYAPNFIAPAILKDGSIIDEFNFKENIKNKIAILFFWPMDFTFVCPTEIISFNKLYNEFKNKNTEIIGVSRDSVFVHQAWQNIEIKKGGIGKLKYTLISDIKGEIQESYDIAHPTLGISLRASFLIDTKGIVRHQVVNDLPFGRNIKDMLRMIDAIHFYEKHGEVCPANWTKGKKTMHPSKDGLIKYYHNN
ncbi:redoxin domain-containing protein [Buchnera aphidicola]|uniref:Thioredoxin peroxidase n=1 Tax=Buchnera aphidicola (Therioaphis trifolii) TaxID=1241884 RepID=A0A4D6YPH0_9GAMM|nr:redoxin domain-containing protein [Buchnera aphidicola]QCI27135.1 peroxiredoxin [Buchnera aphidicola (Therioaphis trifolii)]